MRVQLQLKTTGFPLIAACIPLPARYGAEPSASPLFRRCHEREWREAGGQREADRHQRAAGSFQLQLH